MYQYVRPNSPVTCFVRIYGGQEEVERWRTAARQAGFRPQEGQDQDGHPLLVVLVPDQAQVAVLLRLMHRENLNGSLEHLS